MAQAGGVVGTYGSTEMVGRLRWMVNADLMYLLIRQTDKCLAGDSDPQDLKKVTMKARRKSEEIILGMLVS
jgi:hypothetical protein